MTPTPTSTVLVHSSQTLKLVPAEAHQSPQTTCLGGTIFPARLHFFPGLWQRITHTAGTQLTPTVACHSREGIQMATAIMEARDPGICLVTFPM